MGSFLRALLIVAFVAAGPTRRASAQASEVESEGEGESDVDGEVEAEPDVEPEPEPDVESDDDATPEPLSYVLERIQVRGNRRTGNEVILNLVPLRGGETIDPGDARLEQARYQLLGTGFFSSVELSLRRGSERGNVVLLVQVVERNTFFLEQIALGVSRGFVDVRTGDTRGRDFEPYFGLTGAETNLFGAGLTLRGSVVGSGPQQGIRLSLADPTFLGSTEALSIVGFFNRAREFFGDDDVLVTPIGCATSMPCEATPNAIVEYLRAGGIVGVTIPVQPTLRFAARWAFEVVDVLNRPDAASELVGTEVVPIDFAIHDGTSEVSRIELGVTLDTRDDPVTTRSGVVLAAQVDLSAFLIGSSYDYFRGELTYRHWVTLPEWDHTLRFSFFGAVALGDVPFFHQLYASDLSDLIPSRMLEMNLDRRGPPNLFRNSIRELRFAHLAARLDLEYSVRIFGGDPVLRSGFLYANAGVYVLAQPSFFTRPIPGYSGIDAFPWDLTFDVGLRFETPIGVFQIGFSTLLGFISFE